MLYFNKPHRTQTGNNKNNYRHMKTVLIDWRKIAPKYVLSRGQLYSLKTKYTQFGPPN